jgi:hypothetical protein
MEMGVPLGTLSTSNKVRMNALLKGNLVFIGGGISNSLIYVALKVR